MFDSVPPVMAAAPMALAATATSSSVAVTFLQAATDDASGVASYTVVGRQASSAPSKCTSAALKKAQSLGLASVQPAVTASAGAAAMPMSVSFSGLKPAASYAFRVCATDNAGNMATGITVVAKTAAAA
jgi:hypothetical protein